MPQEQPPHASNSSSHSHTTRNNISSATMATASSSATSASNDQPQQQDEQDQLNTNHGEDDVPKASEPVKREETPFSLKHFLKRNTTSNNNAAGTAYCPTTSTAPSHSAPILPDVDSQANYTSSTGARPKVPLNNSTSNTVYETAKMKRSPKFSSFDSQASLAEFSASTSSTSLPTTSNIAHPSYHLPIAAAASTADTYPEHCDASDKASFQRSVSTFDIGAGGRRYNTNHRLEGFLRTASIPIADDLLESPTHHTAYDKPQRRVGSLAQDISSALPDFVQDHILVENLYNNYTPNMSPHSIQYDHLPDFAINDNAGGDDGTRRSSNRPANNMPFDLMCNNSSAEPSAGRIPEPLSFDLSLGLDEPSSSRPRVRTGNSSASNHDIPLDLTARNESPFGERMNHNLNGRRSNNPVASYVSSGEGPVVGESFQRLPDFLSDGHIHSSSASRQQQQQQPPNHISGISPGLSVPPEPPVELMAALDVTAAGNMANNTQRTHLNNLQLENARLRQQLDQCNTTMADQAIIITGLQATVDEVDRDQLQRMNEATAQTGVVAALQRQIQELNIQVEILLKENAILKEEGAVGGAASATPPCALPNRMVIQSQELARDMRLAASSAENNLRQLLSGVDNLRIMAQRMEQLTELDIRSPSSLASQQRHIDDDDDEDDDDALFHWNKDDFKHADP